MILNIRPCLLFCEILLIVTIISKCLSLNTPDMDRPGRNLCVNKSQDCSNQVTSKDNSNASCYMTFLRSNSTDCMASEFTGEVDTTEAHGIVSLNPFPWYTHGIRQPNLNVTFSNINWKSLRMRYVKVGFDQTQFCRKFEVSGDIDPSSVISFDCSWNGSSAGEKYKFEYVLTSNEGHKFLHTFLLQIPTETDVASDVDVENYHTFIMMDQTAYPVISAKIKVPPRRLNITDIIITLIYKEHLGNNLKPLKYVTVDLTEREEGEFITASVHDTSRIPGIYYFTANCQSGNSNRRCLESSTPPLQIFGSNTDFQVMLSILLIAMAAIGLLIFYILKRKQDKVPNGKPSVLFVYESTYPSHIENIYKFKEFLDCNCLINTKLDLIDIPKTDSMNPWRWYYKTFEEADYVLIFASPKGTTEKGVHEDNVYHNLQTYALRLLVNYMLTKHKFSVASVRLPGCSWKTLPPEICGLIGISSRFALPEKLSSMLEYMNISSIPNGASKFISALQQSRKPPQITVPRQIPSMRFPSFYQCDDESQELVLPNWVHLNLDGQSSSEDDEDEERRFSSIDTLNL